MAPEPTSSTTRDSAFDASPDGAASIGNLVKDASAHLSTIMRGEIELAKAEIAQSAKRAGIGAAAFAAAGTLAMIALLFGIVAFAEGITALGMPRWLSYLIMFGGLLIIAGIAAAVGAVAIKKVSKPERSMGSMKETAAMAKNFRH